MHISLGSLTIASIFIMGISALQIDSGNGTSLTTGQTAGQTRTRVPPAIHVDPPLTTTAPNNTHSVPKITHDVHTTKSSQTDSNFMAHSNPAVEQAESSTAETDSTKTTSDQQNRTQQPTSAPVSPNESNKASLQLWQGLFATLAAFWWY